MNASQRFTLFVNKMGTSWSSLHCGNSPWPSKVQNCFGSTFPTLWIQRLKRIFTTPATDYFCLCSQGNASVATSLLQMKSFFPRAIGMATWKHHIFYVHLHVYWIYGIKTGTNTLCISCRWKCMYLVWFILYPFIILVSPSLSKIYFFIQSPIVVFHHEL